MDDIRLKELRFLQFMAGRSDQRHNKLFYLDMPECREIGLAQTHLLLRGGHMPPVYGYCRVSSQHQVEDGVSLQAQRAKILAYCRLHGLGLGGIETDEGVSAKDIQGRPGLVRLLALVRDRRVDGIVVYSLSRLVRSTRDALDLASLLRAKGVALHSITEKLDTTSPQGAFFFTLMAALGEMERAQVGERTSAALRWKRANREKTGGRVPYGFCVRNVGGVKRLAAIPAEQATLAWMWRQRLAGRSLRDLAASLNRRRVRGKAGGRWTATTVRRCLKGYALDRGEAWTPGPARLRSKAG